MVDREPTYYEGVLEGKITGNSRTLTALHERVDRLEARVVAIERIQYLLLGGILVFQAIPLIREVVA